MIAGLLGLFLGSQAGAATASDATAGPTSSRPQFAVSPAEVFLRETDTSGTFSVRNTGKAELLFEVSAYDFVVDPDGARVPSPVAGPRGAAAWLKLGTTTFTLAPGASTPVGFTVDVPTNASPGDHMAGINVVATLSNLAWTAEQARSGSAAVRTRVAFPVTVIARAPGVVTQALSSDPGIPGLAVAWGSYTFAPRIANGGNVAAVWGPDAPSLLLSGGFAWWTSERVLTLADAATFGGSVTVLPGAATRLELAIADIPLLGLYTYVLTLPGSEAEGRATVTTSGSVALVSLPKLLLFGLLVAALLALAWRCRVWYLHRRLGQMLTAEQQEQEQERLRQEILDGIERELAALYAPPAEMAWRADDRGSFGDLRRS
jgi:hypothetical protein